MSLRTISKLKARNNTKKQQQGLSLVELMVAMTISLFLLAGIGLVYQSTKTGFTYANNTARMGEDASFAIEALSRDIRMAGYAGCSGTNIASSAGPDGTMGTADDVIDDPTDKASTSSPKLLNVRTYVPSSTMPNPFGGPVYTSNNVILGFPNTTTTLATAATAIGIDTSTAFTPVAGMPILYLAGGSPQAVQIGAAVANGQVLAATSRDSGNSVNIGADPHSYPTNSWMIISDCKGSEIFRATKGTAAGVTYMDSQSTLPSPVTATDFIFQNTYGTDAVITPLVTSTYFIATRNGAATPSLYVRQFNGTTSTGLTQEVVPNIEAITYQYGENTTNTAAGLPTYRPDVYRANGTTVTNWSRVVSVRIGFIVVSEEPTANATAQAATIPWLGGNYTPLSTTDGRLRRAYSTTVSIRNRAGL
jgi:type IV pilus assembly protein PilW